MHKVLITGLGVVSPNGGSIAEFWESLLFRDSSPVQGYPELEGRLPNQSIFLCPTKKGETRSLRPALAMSLDAAGQALRDAGLADLRGLSAGVSVGTTMGDESQLESLRSGHNTEVTEGEYPFQIAANLASRFGCEGQNHTISNACTSGLYALDIAAEAIRNGEADLMLAGGVESSSRIVLACFNRLGALDQGVCRPFDKERKGTLLGEGAAFAVLESEESWIRRGMPPVYGQIRGSGWSCDGHQPTAPDPGGEQIVRALRECLERSKAVAQEVECILPHGTGTPLNDALEARILTEIFSGKDVRPILTAIKSKLGHSGGASGAFSLVTACLIMRHGKVPPTANLRELDGQMQVRIPVEGPLSEAVKNVMISAYAFGGNNISVLVGTP